MSAGGPVIMASCAVFILLLLGAGCTSTTIGDAAYRNGSIIVSVTGSGDPADAFMQVTVYEIKDLQQQKMTTFLAPVTIRSGKNDVVVPGTLLPGRYKLYIYLLKPDERQTATIRDIVV